MSTQTKLHLPVTNSIPHIMYALEQLACGNSRSQYGWG